MLSFIWIFRFFFQCLHSRLFLCNEDTPFMYAVIQKTFLDLWLLARHTWILLAHQCWHYNKLAGVSNLWPMGHMGPRMAVNVAQHKIVNLLKTLWGFLWLHVTVYLMCGPRQLFFFQCGIEMPKVWTPLLKHCISVSNTSHVDCMS